MPNSFISISGFETIHQRLKKLPREAQDAGVEESNDYMVKVMQTYPPKPKGAFLWTSDRQRKAVMAKLREQGGAPYQRTQELRNGWKTDGKGFMQIVKNETPYVGFVQDRNQIQGHAANGWMTVNTMLKEKGKQILQKFDAGVKKAIRKLHL